ncbi:unnamed protein product [Bursaphelenchus xylophilus]|nr:unnamed protein product [Bursaphelenchus xylophilus]CAG9131974.1 unnamed protein product [Bursaphelenchus xylophilus]
MPGERGPVCPHGPDGLPGRAGHQGAAGPRGFFGPKVAPDFVVLQVTIRSPESVYQSVGKITADRRSKMSRLAAIAHQIPSRGLQSQSDDERLRGATIRRFFPDRPIKDPQGEPGEKGESKTVDFMSRLVICQVGKNFSLCIYS